MRAEPANDICREIADLIEGYAIGALNDREMLQVAAHISACPEEQARLYQYEETVGALGLGAASITPPPSLWERLNASTAIEPARQPIPLRPAPTKRVLVPSWLPIALAAAAVLLLISSLSLGVALRRANDDDSATFDSTMAAYLTSGGQVIPLASLDTPDTLGWAGRGSLLVAPDRPPVIVVDKCVPSSKGYSYVVWLQRGDQRTPMGTIEIGKDGRGMMKLEGADTLESYDVLGISIHTGDDWTYDVMTGSPKQHN